LKRIRVWSLIILLIAMAVSYYALAELILLNGQSNVTIRFFGFAGLILAVIGSAFYLVYAALNPKTKPNPSQNAPTP